MHEVLVNRLGGLSLPRKSVVRLTDRPDMTLDVYRGRKTTMQQCKYLLPAKKFISNTVYSFLSRLSAKFCFLPRLSRKQNHADSPGRKLFFSQLVVSAGSKRLRTVSVESRYEGQSLLVDL